MRTTPHSRRRASRSGPCTTRRRPAGSRPRRSWTVQRDAMAGAVVASPEPQSIIEMETIRTLVDLDVIVISAGGGGMPVVEQRRPPARRGGRHRQGPVGGAPCPGATGGRAPAAHRRRRHPARLRDTGGRSLREATPASLASLNLPAGSMGPKAEAARRFVEQGGSVAAIASLDNARGALKGNAGTIVRQARAVRPVWGERMKRVVVDRFGGPEVLKVVEEDAPRPGAGQVRLQGPGRGRVVHRRADPSRHVPSCLKPPFTPGYELVGIVEGSAQDARPA